MTTHHDMTLSHYLQSVGIHTKEIIKVYYVCFIISKYNCGSYNKRTLLTLSIPCPFPLDNYWSIFT